MNACPNCNGDLDEGARFCSNCGQNLSSDNLVNTQRIEPLVTDSVSIGATLRNRFLIMTEIGTGKMGVVYKAKDIVLEEVVALKVLDPEFSADEEMISRFKSEIKIARKIKHPNVCRIYNFGSFGNVFFISMEFIDGQNLSKLLKDKKIPVDNLVPIAKGIVRALGAAHHEKVIHRDLKPSNIIIDHQYRPIIMDFGLARHKEKIDLTAQPEILGTPAYMSPEQFHDGTIDERSDIYSLGVIFYELFTGHLPFQGETPVSIAMKHMQEKPKTPRKLNPDIQPHVEKIILTALEKDPAKRFQKVEEILQSFKSGKTVATQKKKKAKILIADDDEDIRKLLSIILEKNGYETVVAKNGEEAITQAMEEKPTLICMDLMMPKMDGYQAVEFLRDNALTASIPIIMVTCKSDKEYQAYSKSIGVKEYITKPLDINKLLEIIKNIIPA
ncbi:protein kinase [candidate division CSSED10-310 bacterium]|uniref:Protein kinase n=1 Tax=candidate division CSSED10-310 bacterium TaxID=2855610 RepID=A0ABV6Z2S9_UNCC1